MTILQQTLADGLPEFEFKFDYPLADHAYFKLGGPAEAWLELNQADDVIKLVKFCSQQQLKLTVLGGASNVVIADEGISGVVLKLTNSQVKEVEPGLIRAGAGVKTALLVSQTVALGYTGLEYFLGVPGTLGGAVYNNAHYLEDLISAHIQRVQVITPQGELNWLSHDECQFGYDSSRFQKSGEIILAAEFRLERGTKEQSQALIKEATLYRAQTQPLGMPSSGCIFKNPPNTPELKKQFPQFQDRQFIPGGFLIDQAGLKGTRVGDLEVSEKHAAFMINHGQGTAADLKKLVKLVKNSVHEKFGVELQEEVFYLT